MNIKDLILEEIKSEKKVGSLFIKEVRIDEVIEIPEILLEREDFFNYQDFIVKKVSLNLIDGLKLLEKLYGNKLFYGCLLDIYEFDFKYWFGDRKLINFSEVLMINNRKEFVKNHLDNVYGKFNFYLYFYKKEPVLKKLNKDEEKLLEFEVDLYLRSFCDIDLVLGLKMDELMEIIEASSLAQKFINNSFIDLQKIIPKKKENSLFSIPVTVLASELSYPYYGNIVFNFGSKIEVIYEGIFGSPNIKPNSICLGNFSNDNILNYFVLKDGNLNSPYKTKIVLDDVGLLDTYIYLLKNIIKNLIKELLKQLEEV
ncbi:MAG: hypothetical protein KatS3mg068_1549 [Candidatus Sericytochromatia bacterium]|nr:MAG: hypothetical protein KatS3mg068_1549 [Candidatus Sericytochromatia bacterium]